MTKFMSLLYVLPEAVCCSLQTCNFVVVCMLLVYKVLTSSELVCASVLPEGTCYRLQTCNFVC